MIIKNAEIEGFLNFLMEIELKGKDSRLRTRFCKFLIDRQNLITEEHAELLKEYAKFDDDGNPISVYSERLQREIYDIPNQREFQKEYTALMMEDFLLENNEERREIFLKVKDLVLNSEQVFKGEDALVYDRWCEIVETIEYEEED